LTAGKRGILILGETAYTHSCLRQMSRDICRPFADTSLVYFPGERKHARKAINHTLLARLKKFSGKPLVVPIATTDFNDFDIIERETSRWEMIHQQRIEAREGGEDLPYDQDLDCDHGPY
jgi:hypothetical protein